MISGADVLLEPLSRGVSSDLVKVSFTPGTDATVTLERAASDLYDETTGRSRFRLEEREFSSDGFAELMIAWRQKYPTISIEDPTADTD